MTQIFLSRDTTIICFSAWLSTSWTSWQITTESFSSLMCWWTRLMSQTMTMSTLGTARCWHARLLIKCSGTQNSSQARNKNSTSNRSALRSTSWSMILVFKQRTRISLTTFIQLTLPYWPALQTRTIWLDISSSFSKHLFSLWVRRATMMS